MHKSIILDNYVNSNVGGTALKLVNNCCFAGILLFGVFVPVSKSYGIDSPAAKGRSAIQIPMALGQHVLRPSLNSGSNVKRYSLGATARVKVDSLSNAPRLITDNGFGRNQLDFGNQSDFRLHVQEFVGDHSAIFGVAVSDLELNEESTLFDSEAQALKYRVNYEGIWIEDAVVDFRFRRGKLLQIVNRTYSEALRDKRSPLGDLDSISQSYFEGGLLSFTDNRYRVVPTESTYQMIRVRSYNLKFQGESYLLQIESATGKIFEIRRQNIYADGQVRSQVYPRDWTDAPVSVAMPHMNIINGESTIVSDDAGGFEAEADDSPSLSGFKGPFVDVIADSGEVAAAEGVYSNGKWDLSFVSPARQEPYGDQSIAQPMAFYHVQKIREFAKNFIDADWLEESLPVHTNYESNCNAFWNGSSINLLNAGNDCAHAGLVADVIYHEWGHGLDHNTGGIADVAFSEGFSDATSMLITKSNILAPNFFVDGRWVRDMEPDKVYPDDRGEVHAEGLIIGSTLWDVFKTFRSIYGDEVATQKLANLLFKSILTATNYTDVYDSFLFLDDDDGDLSNGTPHSCVFNIEFTKHGLAEVIDSCRLVLVDDFIVDDSDGNGNGVVDPGETVSISLEVSNPSSVVLSGLKGVVRVPNIEGISIDVGEIEWADIPVGSRARNLFPAKITVDGDVACGQPIDLNIRLHQGHRNHVIDKEVEVGELNARPLAYTVADLPADIPDAGNKDFVMWLKGADWPIGMKVYDAHLKFDVTHPYSGDVEVHLITPDGDDKKLIRGIGGADDMHYDKNITQLFKGQEGRGIWTVNVKDWGQDDMGTLDTLTLTLTPAKFRCTE